MDVTIGTSEDELLLLSSFPGNFEELVGNGSKPLNLTAFRQSDPSDGTPPAGNIYNHQTCVGICFHRGIGMLDRAHPPVSSSTVHDVPSAGDGAVPRRYRIFPCLRSERSHGTARNGRLDSRRKRQRRHVQYAGASCDDR